MEHQLILVIIMALLFEVVVPFSALVAEPRSTVLGLEHWHGWMDPFASGLLEEGGDWTVEFNFWLFGVCVGDGFAGGGVV